MFEIIAALISSVATIAAAVIATRRAGPAGEPPYLAPAMGGVASQLPAGRISRSFWLGMAGLVLWVIPLLGYVAVIPGLYVGIRDHGGPRRNAGAGIIMCSISLALALMNSAIGAYQGAHGVGWWQQ